MGWTEENFVTIGTRRNMHTRSTLNLYVAIGYKYYMIFGICRRISLEPDITPSAALLSFSTRTANVRR